MNYSWTTFLVIMMCNCPHHWTIFSCPIHAIYTAQHCRDAVLHLMHLDEPSIITLSWPPHVLVSKSGNNNMTNFLRNKRLVESAICKYSSNWSTTFPYANCLKAIVHFWIGWSPSHPLASERFWKYESRTTIVLAMHKNNDRRIRNHCKNRESSYIRLSEKNSL